MLLARGRGSHNKFADASKVLYGEQLKQPSVNGSTQFVTMNGGVGPMSAPSNGTLSSVHSQRISLNINPLNELDESYAANENHQVDVLPVCVVFCVIVYNIYTVFYNIRLLYNIIYTVLDSIIHKHFILYTLYYI